MLAERRRRRRIRGEAARTESQASLRIVSLDALLVPPDGARAPISVRCRVGEVERGARRRGSARLAGSGESAHAAGLHDAVGVDPLVGLVEQRGAINAGGLEKGFNAARVVANVRRHVVHLAAQHHPCVVGGVVLPHLGERPLLPRLFVCVLVDSADSASHVGAALAEAHPIHQAEARLERHLAARLLEDAIGFWHLGDCVRDHERVSQRWPSQIRPRADEFAPRKDSGLANLLPRLPGASRVPGCKPSSFRQKAPSWHKTFVCNGAQPPPNNCSAPAGPACPRRLSRVSTGAP